jgi:GLPGLI family protein
MTTVSLKSFVLCSGLLIGTAQVALAQTPETALGQVIYTQQLARKTDTPVANKVYLNRDMTLYFGKTSSLYQISGNSIVNNTKIKFAGDAADSTKIDMGKVRDEVKSRLPQGNATRFGSILFKDYTTGDLLTQQTAFDSDYLITDTTNRINWTISADTKMIGEKNCRKGTGMFRGRTYTAWFTPEIPVPAGPWKLGGLPGLILEAYDDANEVKFTFVSLNIPATQAVTINRLALTGKATTMEEFSKEASRRAESMANMMKASGNRVSSTNIQIVAMELPAKR